MVQLDAGWLLSRLAQRSVDAHKGNMGTLTVIAGCSRYRGAAVLAAMGALRAGVGMVRVASTEKVCAAVASRLPCAILHPLPEGDDGGIAEGVSGIIYGATAALVGCGLGNTKATSSLIDAVLAEATCPLVLDADAINVLSGHLDGGQDSGARMRRLISLRAAARKVPVTVTPHIGEMARLSGLTSAEVSLGQEQVASSLARELGCVVVLKSHMTIVAAPDGRLFINRGTGNSGLARGGSGDVLAGIIASLAAQGIEPATAAAAGVWLHAAAADLAADETGLAGLSPDELPLYLAKLWRKLGL